MKKFLVILLSVCAIASHAQQVEITKPIDSLNDGKLKVVIFTPLFLDSAFDATGNYRFGKTFPKYINPGLEFYEGAKLALDSLVKERANVEVFIKDTRSTTVSLAQQLSDESLAGVDLIISHNTSQEMRMFADAALRMKIPFINVNLPNDGGVNSNPYVILLNSTLKTHTEGINRYLQKYHILDPVIMFRKKGVLEDQIKNFFIDANRTTAAVPVTIKYVDIDLSTSAAKIASHLDSTRNNVIVAGSLDDVFGKMLAQQLASLTKTYPIKLIGMPTWDGIRDFSKPEYKGLEIVYSTPFFNMRTDKVSTSIVNYFNNTMFARPSDMVFRGYEATLRFIKMLLLYKNDLASNITRKQFNVFRDFDIQPVFLNKQAMTLDYFENKRLYFVKLVDGNIVSAQ